MRIDAKVDGNQKQLVADLRKLGAAVVPTHTLGKGKPDILVGYRGRNFWFEIKDPAQPPSKRKLTSDEKKFHEKWPGQVAVVKDIVDCLKVFNKAD